MHWNLTRNRGAMVTDRIRKAVGTKKFQKKKCLEKVTQEKTKSPLIVRLTTRWS
jgi:hypothetical protein